MKKFALMMTVLFPIGTGISIFWINSLQGFLDEERIRTKKLEAKLDMSEENDRNLSKMSDSLISANAFLFSQKQLTTIMNFRDSSLRKFPFHPGDVAMMKPDSSRVLIVDVIVGGGKFNYYVQCVIRKTDGSRESVFPEDLIK
jgi:hypothetical protein